MTVEVRLDRDLQAQIDAFRGAITPGLAQLVLRGAQHVTGEIRQTVMEGSQGSTGKLARSFREAFLGSTNGVTSAASYSDLVYARIQDEGGEIRPRRKYLAVPLHENGRIPVGKWPRHWPAGKLRLILGARGGVLVEVRGRRAERLIPRYALTRRVRIKPKHYLAEAGAKAQPGVAALIAEGLERLARERLR